MDSGQLNLFAVVVVTVGGLIVGFIRGRDSLARDGLALALFGFAFLVAARAYGAVADYSQPAIHAVYFLREGSEAWGIGQLVVVGYSALVGSLVKFARALLRPGHGRANDA